MKRSLICLCLVTLAASIGLGIMEIVLNQETTLYNPGNVPYSHTLLQLDRS